jgi:tetratricopeptide (TPR) repeat protein
VALNRRLVEEVPGDPGYCRDLASTCTHMSNHLRATGQKEAALTWAAEAVNILESLSAKDPADSDIRYELAGFSMNLGAAYFDLGRLPQAEEITRRCQKQFRKLAADFPSTPQYQFYLAGVTMNLGNALKPSRPQEAEQAYKESIDLYARLAASYPQVTDYLLNQGGSHFYLARFYRHYKRPEEARSAAEQAVPFVRQALERTPTPNQAFTRNLLRNITVFLTETHLELSDHAAAARTAADLPPLYPDNGDEYYQAAGFQARASAVAAKDQKLAADGRAAAAKSCADRAMTLLAEAVRKGFRDGERLRTDPNLAPLRSHEGFDPLLRELQKLKKDSTP